MEWLVYVYVFFFAFKVVGSDISSRLSRIPVFSEVMMKWDVKQLIYIDIFWEDLSINMMQ